MRVGIVVDSTCDLPASLLKRHEVYVLANRLQLGHHWFIDDREKEAALELYAARHAGPHPRQRPYLETDERLAGEAIEQLIYQYDQLLVIAPRYQLSPGLQHFRQLIFQAQAKIEGLRRAAGLTNRFKLRFFESRTGLSGYGMLLYEALRLQGEKALSVDQIKPKLTRLQADVTTYLLPTTTSDDLSTVNQGAFQLAWLQKQKLKLARQTPLYEINRSGISRTGQVSALRAFEEFFTHLQGLLPHPPVPTVINISYAGKLASLRINKDFQQLQGAVKLGGGKIMLSVMSPTMGLQLGTGALSVTFLNSA